MHFYLKTRVWQSRYVLQYTSLNQILIVVLPPPPQKTKNKTQKLITIPTLPLQINNKKQNQKKKTKLMNKQVYSLKLCLQTDYRTCPGQSVQWPRLFFHIKRYKGISLIRKLTRFYTAWYQSWGHLYSILSIHMRYCPL